MTNKTGYRYELAAEINGDWELIGDFDDELGVLEAIGDYVDRNGTTRFGLSRDPLSGHYESSFVVTDENLPRDLSPGAVQSRLRELLG